MRGHDDAASRFSKNGSGRSLSPGLDLGDRMLAGHFMVPVEQIAEKRADLR